MASSKRHVHGQVALMVVLFIIIFTLSGTTWHLYSLQSKADAAAKENLKEQQRVADKLKDTIEDLSEKVKSVKEELYTQTDKASRIEKDTASVKKSVDDIKGDIQNQIKNEVLSLKDEQKQVQDKTKTSLTKLQAELDLLTTQLKQMEEFQKKQPVPVIDVQVEPVMPKKGRK